jgi:tetratricopeptide (TPR) repeat protein
MITKFGIRLLSIVLAGTILGCGPKPGPAIKFQEYVKKAQQQMADQRYSQAIDNFRKALKLKENDPQVFRDIAQCYEKLGNTDSAVAYYEGAIVFNPKDIDSYQQVGDIYYGQKDYHEAMTWYDRASEIGILSSSSYVALGNIYYRWREFTRAREYFQQSVQIDSGCSEGYYGSGMIDLAFGDTSAASNEFEKATQIGKLPKATYFLGLIEYNRNQFEKADEWLKLYLQQDSTGEFAARANEYIRLIAIKKQGE